MGVELWDIINKNEKTMIIFKLTQRDFNKWGEFIEVLYENLYLYPNAFVRAVAEHYTIPTEPQGIGINMLDEWLNVAIERKLNESNDFSSFAGKEEEEKEKRKLYYKSFTFKKFNDDYLKALFNVNTQSLKRNENKIKIIKLQ